MKKRKSLPRWRTLEKYSPQWHEFRIALDTVSNPSWALVTNITLEEAKETLLHYGYTQQQIDKIEAQ